MACLAATFATAYFIAIILLDLITREWRRVPGHALFGVFAVLLLGFICEKGSEGMAWTLLLAPFIFLILGYFVRVLTAFDWKSYFIQFMSGAEEGTRNYYYRRECAAEPCECGKPCPHNVSGGGGSGSGPGSGSGSGSGGWGGWGGWEWGGWGWQWNSGSGGNGSGGSSSGGNGSGQPKPGSCIKGTIAD